jgi:hypothetical protein
MDSNSQSVSIPATVRKAPTQAELAATNYKSGSSAAWFRMYCVQIGSLTHQNRTAPLRQAAAVLFSCDGKAAFALSAVAIN